MHLFYAPDFAPPEYILNEEESRHCIRVLRLRTGDDIHITDGKGNLFCCRIVRPDPQRCLVATVNEEREYGKLPYRLTMAVAPTKNADRFEWFLEKATEIGVAEIVPLETAHSERRTFKPERAEKVITSAMKQSLKAYRPLLHPLTPFEAFVGRPFPCRRLIAHCEEALSPAGKRPMVCVLRAGEDAQVLIGPEGDFSPEEVALALRCGFEEITLGTQRLRTETAAVTATVMAAVVNTPDYHE